MNWEVLSLTRFLLAFVVMLGHLQLSVPIGFLHWYTYLGSFEAVLGFMLISGLSIGTSITRNKNDYFKRRIQRIYPVYLSSISFHLLVGGVTLKIKFLLLILLNVLFLNQVVTYSSFVGPAWTLALEVWLYILSPYLLKLNKKTLYTIILLSFFSYIIHTCGRTLSHWRFYSGMNLGLNLIFLSFIWIAGFVLAIFPENKKFNSILIGLLFFGHLSVTIAIQIASRIKHNELDLIIQQDLLSFIGRTCCLAFVFFVVVFNHKIPTFKPSTAKIFHLLGNISYPLYLTHFTTYLLFRKIHLTNFPIMILSALIVSFLIYSLFDFYSKRRLAR